MACSRAKFTCTFTFLCVNIANMCRSGGKAQRMSREAFRITTLFLRSLVTKNKQVTTFHDTVLNARTDVDISALTGNRMPNVCDRWMNKYARYLSAATLHFTTLTCTDLGSNLNLRGESQATITLSVKTTTTVTSHRYLSDFTQVL